MRDKGGGAEGDLRNIRTIPSKKPAGMRAGPREWRTGPKRGPSRDTDTSIDPMTTLDFKRLETVF